MKEINHYEFQVTIAVAGETKEEAYDHLFDELQYLASLDNLVLGWYDEENDQ